MTACIFSCPEDEAKLFLWWHRALHLLQVQVDQGDPCGLDTLIRSLMAFQNSLVQLGEERLNSGILGAIGLGKKSPLSNRWASSYFVGFSNKLPFCSGKHMNGNILHTECYPVLSVGLSSRICQAFLDELHWKCLPACSNNNFSTTKSMLWKIKLFCGWHTDT